MVSGANPAKRAASHACGVMVISARPSATRGVDFFGGVADRGGEDGGSCGEGKPTLFLFDQAGEVGVGFAAGAHEAWTDGCDTDTFVAEFGV